MLANLFTAKKYLQTMIAVVAIVAILFYDEKPTIQLFVGMFMAAIAVETYQLHGAPSLMRKYVTHLSVTRTSLC